MIRVTIELVSAITGNTSEIGRMYITNDGEGSAERGSYDVAVCRRGTTRIPAPCDLLGPKPTRSGRVENYPRLAYNVWRLISRALLSAFPEEAARERAGVATDGEGRELLLERIDELERQLEEAEHAGAVARTVQG